MKKRDYFIISAVIQIIASIYAIFSSKELAESLGDITEILTSNTSANSALANVGQSYIIAIAIICIFVNGLIIYFATREHLLRYKGKIIACSVISIFTSTYFIVELLALINIIVMAVSKRVNPEDFPPPKEKLPEIKKETVTKDKIIKAIILIIVYSSQFIIGEFLPEEKPITKIVGIIFYIVMLALAIIFFKDLLKEHFKKFKDNIKAYWQNILPEIGKYYLVYFLIAIVAAILCREITSENQKSIMELPLWYSIPLAIIYAPIVEEIIFRGCLRRFIKSDKAFIIVSAIVFGLLHTIFSEQTIDNILFMSLPYMAMGGFLAYLYSKTNNIITNMSFHCFHNTLAMIITILIRI